MEEDPLRLRKRKGGPPRTHHIQNVATKGLAANHLGQQGNVLVSSLPLAQISSGGKMRQRGKKK